MNLHALGWNTFFADHFRQLDHKNRLPARIAVEQKDYCYLAHKRQQKAKKEGKRTGRGGQR